MATMVREIAIEAPPARVWRHVTDPARRDEWLGHLDVDLEPGSVGAFHDDRRHKPVRVDELHDGRSITYTWGDGDRASQVRIEVAPDGDGSRVRVTESTTQVLDGGGAVGDAARDRPSARLATVA